MKLSKCSNNHKILIYTISKTEIFYKHQSPPLPPPLQVKKNKNNPQWRTRAPQPTTTRFLTRRQGEVTSGTKKINLWTLSLTVNVKTIYKWKYATTVFHRWRSEPIWPMVKLAALLSSRKWGSDFVCLTSRSTILNVGTGSFKHHLNLSLVLYSVTTIYQ